MMRSTWILLAAIAVLGVALGVGLTMTNVEPTEIVEPAEAADQALETGEDPRFPPLPPADGPQPKLVVEGDTVHRFGEMELATSGSHTWTFRNLGGYPLEVVQGESTCKCTIAGVEQNKIPPGESAEITLNWTIKGRNPFFRQSAQILTNDPELRRVDLVAEGTITDTVRAVPAYLSARKPRQQPRTFQTKVFCMRTDDFEITGHRFSNKELASFFDVDVQPLGDANLLRSWGARGAVDVTITVRPGLPEEAIQQNLILLTNLPQRPEVMVQLSLAADQAISLFGKGWNAEYGLLDLGDVRSDVGLKRKMRIMIRGADETDFELRVVETDPEFLHVQTGEPERKGNSLSVPLVIEVPPGTPAGSYVGGSQGRLGEVRLETNHPAIPEWSFSVRLNVLP